ncbi:MAG: VanZ family protein [Candidatus Edwardsbacteria bacterium]|nr:VanZ family protein [Candidatus Edwardsbacteria bacterium]
MKFLKPWGPLAVWLALMALATSYPDIHTPKELPQGDKAVHIVSYAVLAVLMLRTGRAYGRGLRDLWWIIPLGLALAGIDEYHQVLIPGRGVSFLDFVFNAIGLLAGLSAGYYRYLRTRRS